MDKRIITNIHYDVYLRALHVKTCVLLANKNNRMMDYAILLYKRAIFYNHFVQILYEVEPRDKNLKST